ncbi:MAG: WD40 repeat domain-containing serine/threonine-protein kinase [Planctomycetaceae bacterium]
MADLTLPPLFDRLVDAKLLSAEEAAAVCRSLQGDESEATLTKHLLRQGLVTRWQLKQSRGGHSKFLLENGRYLLLEEIGRGGMGTVYKARHRRMNRTVALKIINPKRATDKTLIDRFRREVEVCSKLQHEHIVQAYDVGQQEGVTFLVLEYVTGSNLAALVQRDGPMPLDEAAAICLQASAGLAYAHSQGVIHRDIKPQNILLSTSGTTKILDMGLARVEKDAATASTETGITQDGAVMGTVDYMAPEQARDARAADARADLYSLGATLYFLLAGRPPLPGGSTIEKLHRLANEEPEAIGSVRPDCPQELAAVVHRLLEKDPLRRYTTAGDVVRALQPFAAERIAGRPAVTVAVQAAAETKREPENEMTIEQPVPFVTEDRLPTVMSMVRRPKQRSSKMLWWAVGLAVLLIAVGVGVGIRSGTKAENDTSTPPGDLVTGEQPEPKPPSAIRIDLSGHWGGITAFAWSHDGNRMATGGGDAQVRIWDFRSGRELARLRGQPGLPDELAWSHDGRWIAAADALGNLLIWDWESQTKHAAVSRKATNSFSTSAFTKTFAFSPDGRHLAYADGNRVVRFDVKSKTIVDTLTARKTVNFVVYSPNGRSLAFGDVDGRVEFRDGVNGVQRVLFEADQQPKVIAFVSDSTLAVAQPGLVRVCSTHNGKTIRSHQIPSAATVPGNRGVPAVQFTDGARRIILVNQQDVARSIKLASGQDAPLQVPIRGGSWIVESATRRVAVWGSAISLYRLGSARPIREFGTVGLNRLWPALLGGRYVQSAWGSWDLRTGQPVSLPLRSFADATGAVRSIDGDTIVAYSTVSVPVQPKQVCRLESAQQFLGGLRWTRNGQRVYSESSDRKTIRIWDAKTGGIVASHSVPVDSVDWIRPQWLTAADDGGSVVALGTTGNRNRVHVMRQESTKTATTDIANAYNDARLAINGDGTRLSQFHYEGNRIRVRTWDLGTRKEMWSQITNDRSWRYHVTGDYSPSGKYLLVVREILDAESGKPLWRFPEPDHWSHGYSQIADHFGDIFPDDRHVLITVDAQFQIWDFRDNKKKATIFLLPDRESLLFNHETGHWNATPAALQYVRLRHDIGKKAFWLSAGKHAESSGWKNDPTKAGLGFLQSPPGDAAR